MCFMIVPSVPELMGTNVTFIIHNLLIHLEISSYFPALFNFLFCLLEQQHPLTVRFPLLFTMINLLFESGLIHRNFKSHTSFLFPSLFFHIPTGLDVFFFSGLFNLKLFILYFTLVPHLSSCLGGALGFNLFFSL